METVGCFSWFPFPRKKKNSKSGTANGGKALVKTNNHRELITPTTLEYAKDGGKQMIQVLQAAAGLIPVPYVQDAIKVALRVVEACEDVTAIEAQVQELQDRVCHLMLVIVDHVTVRDDSMESIRKEGEKMESEIRALAHTLHFIIKDLNDIKAQNRWILFIFRDTNKTKVDDCMKRVQATLEKFNLANDLNITDTLQNIQVRLDKIHNLTQHVSEQVGDLTEKVETGFSAIKRALEEVKAHTTSTALKRQQMPLKPRIFHGRDDLVEEVGHLLMNEKTSRVCILGPGGMGKTSLALAIVQSPSVQAQFPKENSFWVPCVEATSITLFLQILCASLRVTRDTKDPLEDILYELDTSKEPRLILLDNFETPWNQTDGTQRDMINDILCRLAALSHVALLVTMRATFPPTDDIEWQTKNIPPTDEDACRRIFHDINPRSKDDPDLDKLLKFLGYMPFAVTLMATLGREGHRSARDLLEEWSIAGVDMLAITPEKSMNRSISLSVESNLVKQNPDALLLLATLSMLPGGTTPKRLDWWAPNLKSQAAAITALSKAALVLEGDGDSRNLFVLPVVQSYMHIGNRIPEEVQRHVRKACCKYVLHHASRPGDADFNNDAAALAAEDKNIQSILFSLTPSSVAASPESSAKDGPQSQIAATPYRDDPETLSEVLRALLTFTWHRNDTRASVDLALYTLKVARVSGDKISVAEALFCLGSAYFAVNTFNLADTYLREALKSFKALLPNRDAQRRAAECGLVVADNMGFLRHSGSDIRAVLRNAQAYFEALSDDHGQARCTMELGAAYRYEGDSANALKFLDDAKRKFEKLGRQSGVAECFLHISRTYYNMKRYTEALDAANQGLSIAENVGDSPLRENITQELAFLLVRLHQYGEALEYAKQSLLVDQASGKPLGVAQNFELIGHIYLRQSEFQDAHAAYEAANEAFTSLGQVSMGETGVKQCQRNLANIRQALENPGVEIGFWRLSRDPDCDTLFSPRKDSAEVA